MSTYNRATKFEKLDLTSYNWLCMLRSISCFPQDCLPENTKSSHHHTCPMCNKLKAFRFTDYRKEGNWICSGCGSGNGINLIQSTLGISFPEVVNLINGQSINLPPPIKRKFDNDVDGMTKEDKLKNLKTLRRVSHQSTLMNKNDLAWKYLSKRVPYANFDLMDQTHRFHPNLDFFEEDEKGNVVSRGKFPCLLAVVGNGHNNVTLHRHYLTAQGKKAPFEMAKQQMSGMRKLDGDYINVVTNLNSRVLAVGEGLETMLACATAHLYLINVRSYLNEGNLRKAKVSKDDFDKVIIYADHDKYNERMKCKIGEKAANVLATRLRETGIEVEIRLPLMEETDWCDVWFEAAMKVANLMTKLTSTMYLETSNDPFKIIAGFMEKVK